MMRQRSDQGKPLPHEVHNAMVTLSASVLQLQTASMTSTYSQISLDELTQNPEILDLLASKVAEKLGNKK